MSNYEENEEMIEIDEEQIEDADPLFFLTIQFREGSLLMVAPYIGKEININGEKEMKNKIVTTRLPGAVPKPLF